MVFKRVRNFGLAALVAGSTIYGCNRPTADISKFNDDIVLVACENIDEYNGVVKTLNDRNKLRSGKSKFTFSKKDKYLKVTMPNKNTEGLKNTYIHVVRKENLDDVLPKMESEGIKYDIIQLRGHTSDMHQLYNLTKDYANKTCVLFFGGCDSYNIAQRHEKKNIAPIGGIGVQEAARNTFYIINLIDLLGTDKADSWSELKQEMQKSERSFNHYMPK